MAPFTFVFLIFVGALSAPGLVGGEKKSASPGEAQMHLEDFQPEQHKPVDKNQNITTVISSTTSIDDDLVMRSAIEILKPEYTHPKGAEAFDPYNSERHLTKEIDEDKDDDHDSLDADYDYSDHKKHDDDMDHHDMDEPHNLLPSVDGDHLLQPNADNLPIFLMEPQDSYVVKNKPATLQCRAANALQVFFKCNGVRASASVQFEFVDPQSGVRVVDAECNVTRDQVDEYFGKDRFRCDCYAWTGRGQIRSQPAYVEVAYLKKQFGSAPHSVSVELYGQTSIRCHPPPGAPPAQVHWLKNGAPLAQDTNVLVSAEGHLLVSQATLQDMANYTCVAENVAGKRISEPALLTVYVNGGWSSWSAWSECRCAGRPAAGQRRTRSCSSPHPLNSGEPCAGPAVQRTPDCVPCQTAAVPGRWSPWSEWSRCGRDCKQTRRRQCSGDSPCAGRDLQLVDCTGGHCNIGLDTARHAEEVSTSPSDVALYIGIAVALVVFTVLAVFVFRILKRKNRDQTLYSMTRSDFQPEFFPEPEKKSLSLQPDLTCHGAGGGVGGGGVQHGPSSPRPPGYEFPLALAPYSAPPARAPSEHHYDVPHLTNSYASPADHQMTPCTSSNTESDDYDKKPYSESEHSISSCFTSSGSTYDVATETVTLPVLPPGGQHNTLVELLAVANTATNVSLAATPAGARLSLPAGVALSLPEGALRNKKEHLYLSVLKEDRHRPNLPEGMTQLSPVVKCGPTKVSLNKPVILQFPHCASLKHGFWNLALYTLHPSTPTPSHAHTHTPSHKADVTHWNKIVSLGQETINTPVFTQLDAENIFLVTDFLSSFVLVGESFNGKAVKNLKLAIYAPPVSPMSTLDYNIRLYVFEDTPCALYYCQDQEKKLGGILMDEPKTLVFQDGGSNLCLSLEEIGPGWKAKPGISYQEIPFNHVWNSSSNALHCSFALEQTDTINHILEFKISACQRVNPSYKQTFFVEMHSDFRNSASPLSRHLRIVSMNNRGTVVTENLLESKTLPERSLSSINENNENCMKQKSLTVSDKGINTCIVDDVTPFRLTRSVKKQLCAILDPPNSRGNDWRLLAQQLNVDRYINFFATKGSPTEHILDLWECRHRNTSAVADLAATLRSMGRNDAVHIIETCLGPSWL